MRDVALRALDTARTRGAAYADVRIVHFQSQSVTVRNRNVEGLVVDESLGFGVRVLVDGSWGFAAPPAPTPPPPPAPSAREPGPPLLRGPPGTRARAPATVRPEPSVYNQRERKTFASS